MIKSINGVYRYAQNLCWTKCRSVKSKSNRVNSINSVEDMVSSKLNPSFFMKNIGSSYKNWSKILNKYPQLKTLKAKDVHNTLNMLKKLNFTTDGVLQKPTILQNSELALENRYQIMKECGIDNINITLLAKYITVMNKSSADLKCLGHIPFNLNVMEQMRTCFQDIDLDLQSKDLDNGKTSLKLMRQTIFNYYFQQRLNMNSDDIIKLWKVYGRVRHKSFKSVQNVVKLLLNDLNFSKERISKNAFILYADAHNIKQILHKIPTIGDQDISEILYKRPKILMSPCESLLSILKHIKDFDISEDAVLKCLEVLTLSPDTVLERLKDIHEIEEFQVLKSNPRILRLVHYQNKARLRLEYLNQLKVRCASLHILSCGSEAFAKFARDGSDRTRGKDIIIWLTSVLEKEENEIRSALSRHPNWCHVPLFQIKQCFEFLLKKQFSVDDVYNNIHLLLYPINRIDDKLQKVLSMKPCQDLEPNVIRFCTSTNSKILALILYLIESEFHFTGDGIWAEQYSQNVENFNNLLPDFPECMHKDLWKIKVKCTKYVLIDRSND